MWAMPSQDLLHRLLLKHHLRHSIRHHHHLCLQGHPLLITRLLMLLSLSTSLEVLFPILTPSTRFTYTLVAMMQPDLNTRSPDYHSLQRWVNTTPPTSTAFIWQRLHSLLGRQKRNVLTKKRLNKNESEQRHSVLAFKLKWEKDTRERGMSVSKSLGIPVNRASTHTSRVFSCRVKDTLAFIWKRVSRTKEGYTMTKRV